MHWSIMASCAQNNIFLIYDRQLFYAHISLNIIVRNNEYINIDDDHAFFICIIIIIIILYSYIYIY